MKKLFAIIALIFTLGMMVDFRPEETPPDISSTELTDSELHQVIQAMPVYQVALTPAEVVRYESALLPIDELTFSFDGKHWILNQPTKIPTSQLRIDKEFDPGRCNVI